MICDSFGELKFTFSALTSRCMLFQVRPKFLYISALFGIRLLRYRIETWASLVYFKRQRTSNTKLYRTRLFCMLHLDKNEMQRIQRTRITLKNVDQTAHNDSVNGVQLTWILECLVILTSWIFLFSFVLIVSKKSHFAKGCRTIDKLDINLNV